MIRADWPRMLAFCLATANVLLYVVLLAMGAHANETTADTSHLLAPAALAGLAGAACWFGFAASLQAYLYGGVKRRDVDH